MKIKLNNGYLEFKDGKWYRNGKVIEDLFNYKYYDGSKKSYMRLTYDGKTTPDTPYMDKLSQSAYTEGRFVPNFKASPKIITLRTKGRMNLADVPVNMLDSIAINTGRSRTNIKTNLGLVGKESTFGGHSKYLGRPQGKDEYVNQYSLVNNHAYDDDPFTDYYAALERKYFKGIDFYPFTNHRIPNNYDNFNIPSETQLLKAEKDAEYAYKHNLIKSRTKQYHDNYLADAFARYADNPRRYNPGQGNYVQMVNNIANEVWSDPQIQKWWKTEGIKYYNKGLKE